MVTHGCGSSLERSHKHKPHFAILHEWEELSSPCFPSDFHANLYIDPACAVWNMGGNEYPRYENIATVRLTGGVASWLTEEKFTSHTHTHTPMYSKASLGGRVNCHHSTNTIKSDPPAKVVFLRVLGS